MGKPRLWRVESIHVNGYTAPSSQIENELDRECDAEAEALKLAKENSRLADFDCWSFKVTNLHCRKLDGKWYSLEEFRRRLGR